MKTRTITSAFIILLYALVVYCAIYVHKVFFDVFVLALMIMAALEISKAISKRFSPPINLFIILNCIGGYAAFYFFNIYFEDSGIAAYFAVTGLVFLATAIYTSFSKIYTFRNAVSTMLVCIYPATLLVYMLGINYLPYAEGNTVNAAAILLMFSVSALSDTFAYLVGSTVKGPKLCPAISPKKTISGAVGGLIGGLIGGAGVFLFSYFGWLNVPILSSNPAMNIVHYLVLGFVGSMFTQMGDLFASYVKRQCGVKDFGNILPGHGGIMDRIDGFMFNAVFIYVYLLALAF